jgi:hypothetical protein
VTDGLVPLGEADPPAPAAEDAPPAPAAEDAPPAPAGEVGPLAEEALDPLPPVGAADSGTGALSSNVPEVTIDVT